MGGSIGAVSFPYNLYFVDEYEPAPIRFEDMGFDGTIMQIIVGGTAQLARKIRFEWITQDQLDTLKGYAETGQRYTVNLGGTGGSHVIRFLSKNAITYRPVPPEDGFTHQDVDGTALDLYNGEMNVYVDS